MFELYRRISFSIIILFHTPGAFSDSSEVDVKSENYVENLRTIEFGDVCNKTITESQFLLNSPKYPQAYPPNFNCQLKIESENCPTYYKFKFINFNIENSPGCVKDRLEVGLLDALCGKKNGSKEYLAKNGTLTLNFKTDDTVSATGYRILVTKIEECSKESSDSSKATTKTSSVENHVNTNLKECCHDYSQSSRHFIMNSPNFPASLSYPTDCVIRIHKESPDVCRLRIIFRFFWFGNSLDCREGFMQIDGKTVCGCKGDFKLISKFTENVKVLRFRSAGLIRNSYSGFVAEIFQDDCPKKLTSDITNSTILKVPNIKQDLKFYSTYNKKNFDGFEYPQEIIPQEERESNDFVDTADINGILGNDAHTFERCLQWNQAQFNDIFYGKEIKLSSCQRAEDRKYEEKNCKRFIHQNGYFFNPGYPFFYPGHLKICYRFSKFPGTCGVQIKFLDFRISRSEFCVRDRFSIEGRAYCGIELWNKVVTLDFHDKDFVDLDFITSIAKCAQGFSAYYEYIPCGVIPTESPVPPPITKIFPVPPPTTNRPRLQCGGVVNAEIFNLSNEERSQECVFIVEKFTEDVCQLILKFEQISIDCKSEVLKIDGKSYCGSLSGKEVTIDVREFPVEIVYRTFENRQSGSGFRIRGFQDTTSCQIPEPPAQLNR